MNVRAKRFLIKTAYVISIALFFFTFFNGYVSEGPSKKKFKKLGDDGGVVDLTKEEVIVEKDILKEVMGDKRIKEWSSWWKQCAAGFSLENMDDIGTLAFYEGEVKFMPAGEITDGPWKMFYERSPGGNFYLNPYYGRLRIVKEGDAWQPYIELPCGAALYDMKAKNAKNILECSALEGVDDAFWQGPDRVVMMGYEAITRQMNIECEGTQTCVAPVIWIADMKAKNIHQYRGKVIKRDRCELGGFLKKSLPEFFEAENKEKKK